MPFLFLALPAKIWYFVGCVDEKSLWKSPEDGELEQYAAQTRRSLILRLQDWKDQRSWDEFYRTYWRLIYAVAIRAGLREHEAWDTVQETILTIAKQSRKGAYDPERGSFKMWLWNVTRWRINDQFRLREKDTAAPHDDAPYHPEAVSNMPDVNGETFERIWEREWQENLVKAALERVKMKVSPRQFQIFDYNVLQGMKALEVRRKLGVSMAQVYLAKHRIGSLLRKEIALLQDKGDEKG